VGPGTAAASPVDPAAVDSFLAGQLQRHGLPGMAVGLVEGDQTVHVRGFGTDNTGRPVGPQTPFVLASVSKPLTATAVMQLVDAGQVRLDAPVQQYLPEFTLADAQVAAQVTVRQLLTHTSGLPASACERTVASLEEFVQSLRSVRPDRAPGSRHLYCSGNYNVLGLMVQKLSGEPFGTYVERHIFQPLEMRHSYTTAADARLDGLAVGSRLVFGFRQPMDYENPSGVPSGYLISTAEDMTHFLIAQQNGGQYRGHRLLSAAAVIQMQQPEVDAGQGATYGLGWQQGPIGSVPTVYHFGANYNMETVAMMDPRTHRAAILLLNAQGLLAVNAFRSIEGGLAHLLDGRQPSTSATPLPVVYGVVDTVLVGLTTLILLPLARLPRWVRGQQSRSHQNRRRARLVGRVGAELGAGLGLFLATKLVADQLGATLAELSMLIPDLVPWLWGVSAVLVVTGLAHAYAGRRVLRSRRAAPVQPTPTANGQPDRAGAPVRAGV
jgi:CubicO group peptidase (beta-lactamase class C family)